jgi:hypothetical protein
MERHVVPWLQFNPPAIFLLLGRTRHQAKCRARSLNREGLHHYAAVIEWTQLRHSLLKKVASVIRIQGRTRPEIINFCFNQLPVRVEDINCEELPTNLAAQSWNERCGDEDLQTILSAAEVRPTRLAW